MPPDITPPPPSPRPPIARIVGVAVAAVVALVALALVVRSWRDDSDSTRAGGSPATSATASSTTGAEADATYAVGRRQLELVDTSRPTDAWPDGDVEARPDRPLPTVVLYPTAGHDESDDAAPAEGPFPLVVFSHGSGGNPVVYAPFMEPLVRQGYVVALPKFPLTSLPGSPYDDARNQPADVSFVIDSVLALSDDTASWLGGRLDGDRIAAAGHSLGAITTIGVTYDSCCIDPRIDAAVSISGTGVASGPGTLDDPPPTPLLLVHGARDDTVPVGGSDALFDAATGPTYYLRLDEADHASFILGPAGALTQEVVAAFLDAYLRSRPAALADAGDVVADSGLGAWRTRNIG